MPIPATAFNSVLHGTVTDASSRRPLSGALVALQDGHTSVRTDNKGRYSIKWPGGYTYSVTVDMRGYLGSLMAGRIKAYKSFRLNFALRKKSASNGSMPSPPGFFNGG